MKKSRMVVLILSVISIISILSIIFTYKFNNQRHREIISVIGSADGPTSIIVSDGGILSILICLIALIVIIALIMIYRKKKN